MNIEQNIEPSEPASSIKGKVQKILITGAAGFLGSHLCDKFIKEGMHVSGMDNLITVEL